MADPRGAGQAAIGTESATQAVVATYGASAGGAAPCGAGPPAEETGVLPKWWLLPAEHRRGMAAAAAWPTGLG